MYWGEQVRPEIDIQDFILIDWSKPFSVRYKARANSSNNDISLWFYDISNASNRFRLWQTSYQWQWFYTSWAWVFAITQSGSGGNTITNRRYELSVSWKSFVAKRYTDEYTTLEYTRTHTLPNSVVWYDFRLRMDWGGVDYPWWYFDNLVVISDGNTIFETSFDDDRGIESMTNSSIISWELAVWLSAGWFVDFYYSKPN